MIYSEHESDAFLSNE